MQVCTEQKIAVVPQIMQADGEKVQESGQKIENELDNAHEGTCQEPSRKCGPQHPETDCEVDKKEPGNIAIGQTESKTSAAEGRLAEAPAQMDTEDIPRQDATPPETKAVEREGITPSKPRDSHQKNGSPHAAEPRKVQNNAAKPAKDRAEGEHGLAKAAAKSQEPKLTIPDLFPRGLESRGTGTLVYPEPAPADGGPGFQENMALFYRWLKELDNANINAEHVFGRSL